MISEKWKKFICHVLRLTQWRGECGENLSAWQWRRMCIVCTLNWWKVSICKIMRKLLDFLSYLKWNFSPVVNRKRTLFRNRTALIFLVSNSKLALISMKSMSHGNVVNSKQNVSEYSWFKWKFTEESLWSLHAPVFGSPLYRYIG